MSSDRVVRLYNERYVDNENGQDFNIVKNTIEKKVLSLINVTNIEE